MGQLASKSNQFRPFDCTLPAIRAVQIAANPAEFCAVCATQADVFALHDADDRTPQCSFAFEQEVLSVATTYPGEFLITGCIDGLIRCFSPDSGELLFTLPTTADDDSRHESAVTCIHRIDGDRILTGSEDTSIRLWSLSERRCLQVFINASSTSKPNSAPPTPVTGAGSVPFGATPPAVYVPELAVSAIAYDPITKLVIAGYMNGSILHFNIETGRRVLQLGSNRPGVPVTAMVVLPRWNLMVFANADSTLRVWHLGFGKEIARYRFSVIAMCYSEEKDILFTGDDTGRLSLWKVMVHDAAGNMVSPTAGGPGSIPPTPQIPIPSNGSGPSTPTLSSATNTIMPQIISQMSLSEPPSTGRVLSLTYYPESDSLFACTEGDRKVHVWTNCVQSISDKITNAVAPPPLRRTQSETEADASAPGHESAGAANSLAAASAGLGGNAATSKPAAAEGASGDTSSTAATVTPVHDYTETEVSAILSEIQSPEKTDKTLPFDALTKEKELCHTIVDVLAVTPAIPDVRKDLSLRSKNIDNGLKKVETQFYEAVNRSLKVFNEAKKRIQNDYGFYLNDKEGRSLLVDKFDREETQLRRKHEAELAELKQRRESELSGYDRAVPVMRRTAVSEYVTAKRHFTAYQADLEDTKCGELRKLLSQNLPVPQLTIGSQYVLVCPLNPESDQPSAYEVVDVDAVAERGDSVTKVVHVLSSSVADLLRYYQYDGIAPIRDVIHTEYNSFVITDFFSRTLSSYINDLSPLSDHRGPVAATAMFHLLLSVYHLHCGLPDVAMIHRELRPSNVFLHEGDPCKPKLKHFGIMKPICGEETVRASENNWQFAAPELLVPKPCIGTASDMWSIGVIFAYLLESKDGRRIPLYGGADAHEILISVTELTGMPSARDIRLMMNSLEAPPETRILFESLTATDIPQYLMRSGGRSSINSSEGTMGVGASLSISIDEASRLLLASGNRNANVQELESKEECCEGHGLEKRFKHFLSFDEYDLLSRMLVFAAHRRISAGEALLHPYFQKNVPSEEYLRFSRLLDRIRIEVQAGEDANGHHPESAFVTNERASYADDAVVEPLSSLRVRDGSPRNEEDEDGDQHHRRHSVGRSDDNNGQDEGHSSADNVPAPNSAADAALADLALDHTASFSESADNSDQDE